MASLLFVAGDQSQARVACVYVCMCLIGVAARPVCVCAWELWVGSAFDLACLSPHGLCAGGQDHCVSGSADVTPTLGFRAGRPRLHQGVFRYWMLSLACPARALASPSCPPFPLFK